MLVVGIITRASLEAAGDVRPNWAKNIASEQRAVLQPVIDGMRAVYEASDEVRAGSVLVPLLEPVPMLPRIPGRIKVVILVYGSPRLKKITLEYIDRLMDVLREHARIIEILDVGQSVAVIPSIGGFVIAGRGVRDSCTDRPIAFTIVLVGERPIA